MFSMAEKMNAARLTIVPVSWEPAERAAAGREMTRPRALVIYWAAVGLGFVLAVGAVAMVYPIPMGRAIARAVKESLP